MKPRRIILVRHGESLGNAQPSHYEMTPDYALELTDTGQLQVQKAGEQILNLIGSEQVRAYVSPWCRARQTFDAIATVLGSQVSRVVEDPRIREQEWGHLVTAEKIHNLGKERIAFGPFYYRLPDGESGADVYDRVSGFLETLHRDFAKKDFPENAMIVTHGMTLRIFLMRWFHWSVEYFEKVKNPKNGDVVIMALGEDGYYKLTTPMRLRD